MGFSHFTRRPVGEAFALLLTSALLASCVSAPRGPQAAQPQEKLRYPGETHLRNVRQLTHGGTNAEAYWSYDGQWLTFQAKGGGVPGLPDSKPECDQIYRMRWDGTDAELVSTGKGRTTCAFYLPGDDRILYSSTHATDEACPAEPDRSKGYVWPIYHSYQPYTVQPGKPESILPFEPAAPKAYNAEAVTCRDGSVVFTSDRDGDLDLYVGKLDSFGTLTQVKRVTNIPGYDGGAFFSQDCTKLVWRASRPKPGKELDEYRALLKQQLVRPSKLEIWTANADGSNARQVTRLNAASFAPYFTPKADRILFSSNWEDPRGRSFAIYSIRTNGTGLKKVISSGVFDGFPMFSPDGKKIAFSSNRNGSAPRETNVFVADWIEEPETADQELSFEDTRPADRYLAIVKALSAPEFTGRGVGTPGMRQAEELTASLFERAGLKPFFETFGTTKITARGGRFKHAVQIKMLEGPATEDRPAATFVTGEAPQPLVSSNNILGTLGGGCAAGKAAIVIGAHLDHLGMGAPSSLESTKKGIHHGADDNASGVAALIESARLLTSSATKHQRLMARNCFIFAAFTGEESGVAGSARVVELLRELKVPVKAMLNMDMVGRVIGNRLIVFGTDSAKEWRNWVDEECGALALECPGGGDGYGPSDHMPFYAKGTPVVHLFSGPHADYHRVSDTWEKIHATGGTLVTDLVSKLALRVASHPRPLRYQKPSGTPMMLASGTTTGQQARSGMGGAFLGTIPDYAQMTSPSGPGGDSSNGGVLLSGARADSPAEKAGVQAGDILFEIATNEGARISTPTLKDFMGALRSLKPGDQVTLSIRRSGQVLQLPATIGSRNAQ